MNETRTASILQRVPTILAVTAASYGLSDTPSRGERMRAAAAAHKEGAGPKASAGYNRGMSGLRR